MSAYSEMPKEYVDYIEKRIKEGKKNTYHSIMAVLENKGESAFTQKNKIKKDYIEKYEIEEKDASLFDEFFEYVYKMFLIKNKRMGKTYAIKSVNSVEVNKICDTWDECKNIVSGNLASFKSFYNQKDAIDWLANKTMESALEDEAKQKTAMAVK